VGEVRIIGGLWRRSKLAVPDQPGLRPTPDRVRETLFNWLGQDLSGWHVLDAFAGSGALGFEAASRGAASVQMVEQNPALVRALTESAQRLKATTLEVRRGDGVAALRQTGPATLDLVFLDPPFAGDLFEPALKAAHAAVKPGGWVYLEAPKAWSEADLAAVGYALTRQTKAGQVWAHLLSIA
jgi:16S rRNA (guanine(966)-N(2))-methyltransferase RsmD